MGGEAKAPGQGSALKVTTVVREHPAVGVSRVLAPTGAVVALAVLGVVSGPAALATLAGIAGVHFLARLFARHDTGE